LTFNKFFGIIYAESEVKEMAHKKKNSNPRPTWVGYYTRKTKTKSEKEESVRKKYRKEQYED